jgi:RibD domain-containing protein
MPEVFADVFVRVDGKALGTRSPGYFGYPGPGLERWIVAEQGQARRDVMGRKTYETLAGLPEEQRDESWEATSARPVLVFSRTLAEVAWPDAEVCGEDAVAEVRRLKQVGGEDLRTLGSLSLVQQLLEAGLVDHTDLAASPRTPHEHAPPGSRRDALSVPS